MENEIEKIVIHVDSSDSGTDTEDELETYDEDNYERYRAEVYDCDTEVDVTTDENTLTADTLTADDDCSGDATLTDEETVSADEGLMDYQ